MKSGGINADGHELNSWPSLQKSVISGPRLVSTGYRHGATVGGTSS